MADFNTPATSQNYSTGYTASIVANQKDLGKLLDSGDVTVTNPVANLKRYNATNQLFEKRNSGNTAWEEMPLAYAKLASPTFTGTPLAPTAAADTNTTQLATTAFVIGQAGSSTPIVDGTGAAGSSTRYARQDHVHPTDTSRAPIASPNFSGTPQVSGNTIYHAGNFTPSNYQTVSGMSSYAALSGATFSGAVSGTTWTGSGRVFGNGTSSNNGLGRIIVQSGGTPPSGSQGDICVIY